MNHDSSQSTEKRDVTPLLRSIAEEVVARTLAIAKLDARIGRLESHPDEDQGDLQRMTAVRANHRRELRHIDKELERLGWRRDADTPMRFLALSDKGARVDGWQPEGTSFYRSLDVPTRD